MRLLRIQPYPDLLEESWRELEQERERKRLINEAHAVRRAEQPSRLVLLGKRARRTLRPDPCPELAEGC